MKVFVQGCNIDTDRSYLMIRYGRSVSLEVSYTDDCFYITVPKGFRWSDLVDRRLSILKDQVIQPTEYLDTRNPIYDLNGLRFKKLIPHDYVFSQYLVKDLEEYVMLFNEDQVQLLIPLKSDFEFDKYIYLLKQNPYLELIDTNNIISLKNFYAINLARKQICLESNNEFSFNSKRYYTRYLLSAIDTHESFIKQLRVLLDSFGLSLLTLPIKENTQTVDYVTYRYTDLDKQETHKTDYYPLRREVKKTSHIEFELTTPNMVILDDFKARYQNLDFLTDFTVFQTLDKLGKSWSAECRWGPLTTDFNQDYDQDQQGNRSFKATFSCDLNYYVVYDDQYYAIQKVLLEILSMTDKFNIIKV